MLTKLNILIIDDEEVIRNELQEYFQTTSFKVYMAATPTEGLAIIDNNEIDIVVLDIKMPEMNGVEVLKIIKDFNPDIEVIMISGHGDMENVIQCMRNGASDFFQKPFRLIEIHNAIERTKKVMTLNNRLKALEETLKLFSDNMREANVQDIISESESMEKVKELMYKVGKANDTSVLIYGESGTGKELVARGIHILSDRSDKRFISLNCSAIPETLFESELFGYVKGAFTDAKQNKKGWFQAANDSTLFLDEIGDLPLAVQSKLLRVLEERTITPVGSHESIPINVRIIAATNQDLGKLSKNKEFRLDLFHRLNSFVISLPPLRERKSDIPILLNYYIKMFAERMNKKIKDVDINVIKALSKYDFPGNIRELKNMAERAVILADSNTILPKDFQFDSAESEADTSIFNSTIDNYSSFDLIENEKHLILRALEATQYNKTKASELLNITRQSLNRRLEKYKLENQ